MSTLTKLPEIISSETAGNCCKLELRVPENCIWFEGHFEGAPILSGVAQIDWVMSLAETQLSITQRFHGVDVLKFQNVIQPGDRLTLELEWLSEKQQLRFAMFSDRPLSSGRIALSEDTGP